jgi:dTDP-4-dehydrorhamnose reductase
MVRACARFGHEVIPASRTELDISRDADIRHAFQTARPDVVVNCAAFTNVDGAEDQPAVALEANAFGVRSLARAACDHAATLVHYSTDFVFSGDRDEPYTEEDRPQPQSVYASTKYIGERFAADAARYYVLRVESLFGGPTARSSVDRIIQSLGAGHVTPVFVDRTVSPSYVEDVAMATERLLTLSAPFGLYHCVNSGHTTWYELGREIARAMRVDANLLQAVQVADVKLRAKRPQFAALSNTKLTAAGVPMPAWQDAISRYLETSHAGRQDA